MISLKLLYSGALPKSFYKSERWWSNNSNKPYNPPILSHQPFLWRTAKTLLTMFLQLDPPPTLLGKPPSSIITKAVLVWSSIT